jgi:uncharacterized membrane protein
MKNLTSISKIFIAVAMIAFGVQHCVYRDFITRLVPKLPPSIPAPSLLACVFGVFLIVAGLAILAGFKVRMVGLLLGGVILLSFVVLYLPRLLTSPSNVGVWTNGGKALALTGASLLVAGSVAASAGILDQTLGRLIPLARFFLAAFFILAGVLHFMYAPFVARLVPTWIPGHIFWVYFSGVALIAGGLGIVIARTTRLAAFLSGVMIFMWVLMLHIPRALASPHDANETTAVFEALAMSGAAFLIAMRPRPR